MGRPPVEFQGNITLYQNLNTILPCGLSCLLDDNRETGCGHEHGTVYSSGYHGNEYNALVFAQS